MGDGERAPEWMDRDFLAFHAKTRPDQTVCLAFATDERISYLQLHHRVDKAVAAIRRYVADPRGERLGILARNSTDFLAFVVACYRVGAILLPLNWRLSAAELEFQLQDATPALVIYDQEFAPPFLAAAEGMAQMARVTTSAWRAELDQDDDAPYAPAAMGGDAPFIILYTSGTTGKPKGAIITRLNAFWQSFNFAALTDAGPGSVMLCDSPMFHTVGLIAVSWTTLQKGAMFAISDRFVPAETIARLLDDELGATHYFGVPQIARALLTEPTYKPRALNRLTAFVVGGAPSPQDLIEQLVDDGVHYINGIGMSETGTIAHLPRAFEIIRANIGSVGELAPAMQMKIMDENGVELPDGVAGEMCVRGPAVTPGYWNRPEANASGFFPGGWFRSGDIAMRNPKTGFYAILDRSKDMYISGGENVYPAEVESALLRVPGVRDVAVVGVPDERWGEVGCAYIVLQDGATLQPEQVIAACAQYLAPYKKPKHVRFIEAIPRNAAGKAQKHVLRAQGL
ncbi:MAG: AMP-binding protein [Caulobacteraceae bacterium]